MLVKVNFVTILLPLVVSQYVDTSDEVKPPNSFEEISFRSSAAVPAKLGTVPYQVSIKTPAKKKTYINMCGGSFISPKKILSASICFIKKGQKCRNVCRKSQLISVKKLYAVAGTIENIQVKKDGSEQWRRIRSLKANKNTAIVFTSTSFKFNENIKAVPIAATTIDSTDAACVVSWYGRVDEKDNSSVLMYTQAKLLSKDACSSVGVKNVKSYLCTDFSTTVWIKGNYGSPLLCKKTNDENEKDDGVIVGVAIGTYKKDGKFIPYYVKIKKSLLNENKYFFGNAMKNLPVLNIVCVSLIISNFGWHSI